MYRCTEAAHKKTSNTLALTCYVSKSGVLIPALDFASTGLIYITAAHLVNTTVVNNYLYMRIDAVIWVCTWFLCVLYLSCQYVLPL